MNTTGLDRAATPGEEIRIDLSSPISVNLVVERDQGAENAPLIAELVSNCVNGKPDLIDARSIGVGQNTATWAIEQPHPGGDGKSCYLRVRVRKQNAEEADLMAYSNPIRITFRQLGWFGAAQQKFLPALDSLKTKINTSSRGTEVFSVFSEANNSTPEGKPRKSSNLNQILGQNQELSPFLLVIIVLIVLVLLILALIYFYRSRSFYSGIGTPESIRYDSKISLCSLIFDQLNSVLYVSYGKKYSQISFYRDSCV